MYRLSGGHLEVLLVYQGGPSWNLCAHCFDSTPFGMAAPAFAPLPWRVRPDHRHGCLRTKLHAGAEKAARIRLHAGKVLSLT